MPGRTPFAALSHPGINHRTSQEMSNHEPAQVEYPARAKFTGM